MRHLPVFIDTRGQCIVVCGGGRRAVAKLRTLVRCEARLRVFATDPLPPVCAWAREGRLELLRRAPRAEDLLGARLVHAATGNPREDARVRELAAGTGALVNVVDVLEGSDFVSPAVVDRDPVLVAIGTGAAAPVLARRIKSDIERLLPPGLGAVAERARSLRPAVRALIPAPRRGAFWRSLLEELLEGRLPPPGSASPGKVVRGLLERSRAGAVPPGRVALVGAGPGDPQLLTERGRRLLEEADVVLHDRLVDPRILDLARREAEIIEVGKGPGRGRWEQEAIHGLMVRHARAGDAVVRLKGGDPMLFGRADEELQALRKAGIRAEVVPGISAASAAAARLGASLTRRGRNSAVTFLSGRDASGFAEHDWHVLARPNAVLVIYMGVGVAGLIQGRLLLHGRSPCTPVVILERVGQPGEKVVAGELGTLGELVASRAIQSPAIICVGLRSLDVEVEGERPAVPSHGARAARG